MKFGQLISWIFGILVFINGMLNLFWGNDHALGAAFIVVSFIYIPPFMNWTRERLGFSLHYITKIITALVLIWITVAVGAIAEGYIF